MPKGRLKETYVQQVSVEWLASHYRAREGVRAAVFETEVGVRKGCKLGYGRADGLIVALMSAETPLVASLEAKSSLTEGNVTPWTQDAPWLLHGMLVGAALTVVAGVFTRVADIGLWRWVLLPMVFFLSWFGYLVATFDWHRYRKIDVIDQVRRYPANERWIALSTDALNDLGVQKDTLIADCQRAGVGLLRVSAGRRVTVLAQPRYVALRNGGADLLSCYSRENAIRARLADQVAASAEELGTSDADAGQTTPGKADSPINVLAQSGS